MPTTATFFPGFRSFRLDGAGAAIHGVTGGEGPPLLLLHGYPQTHVIWHRIAPVLAREFTVVATDLRGYGRSDKPGSGPGHEAYSKRAMAADQVAVMRALGHNTFHLMGHDRGGRVAHRLALDHPDALLSLTVLDIAPTRDMYRTGGFAFGRAYYHWFFLIQRSPLPETLIGANPDAFIEYHMSRTLNGLTIFDPEAFAEYRTAFRDPAMIHASCEDYRASATIDITHDEADLDRRIEAPLLVLWGDKGIIGRCFDPLALWRQRARRVVGGPLHCGHYIPEEAPDAVLDAVLPHLRAHG